MTIAVSSFSKLFRSDNGIRRTLMMLLALIMTHLISYQQLPFSSTYQFPIIPFSIFVIYGIFICEVNTWNYRRLASKYGISFDLKRIRRIVQTNLISCTLIFTILTFTQMFIFQSVMNPFRFVGLLSVCLMISAIETSVFIIVEMARQKSRKPITLNKVASAKQVLTILRNNELLTFQEEEVAFLIHQNGCIFLVDKEGHQFTTQFESLNEVEPKLSDQFFRANRQALISRTAVRSVKKDVNNKLRLTVNHLNAPLMVSRYKSKELKDWFRN